MSGKAPTTNLGENSTLALIPGAIKLGTVLTEGCVKLAVQSVDTVVLKGHDNVKSFISDNAVEAKDVENRNQSKIDTCTQSSSEVVKEQQWLLRTRDIVGAFVLDSSAN